VGPIAIGTPYLLGTNAANLVSSVAVPCVQNSNAGDLIVVCTDGFAASGIGFTTSVTDTKSNVYTEITSANSATPTASVWYAQNTTALTTSDTVTATWSGSLAGAGQLNLTVVGCPGIATGGALDQVAVNYTTASALSAATGNLALSTELAIASWVSRQAQGAPVLTSDWNSIAAFQGQANTHYDNVAWQIQDTAEAVTATASTPAAGTGWAVTLVTFRGQLHPTAALSCGGSVTGYPVRAVEATALLGCGGSIVQAGAEGPGLDPYPPPALPVFPAGYGPQQADFGNWVQASFGYITDLAVYRGIQTISQSIGSATFTVITYDTLLEDDFGGWSPAPTSSQPAWSWLAPFTGWFRVSFRVSCAAGSHWLDAAVSVSGANPGQETTGVLAPSAQPGGAGGSVIVPMIGGTDYVQILLWASTSVTTQVSIPGLQSYVEIVPVQTDLVS
jgi:hypothetical protein